MITCQSSAGIIVGFEWRTSKALKHISQRNLDSLSALNSADLNSEPDTVHGVTATHDYICWFFSCSSCSRTTSVGAFKEMLYCAHRVSVKYAGISPHSHSEWTTGSFSPSAHPNTDFEVGTVREQAGFNCTGPESEMKGARHRWGFCSTCYAQHTTMCSGADRKHELHAHT